MCHNLEFLKDMTKQLYLLNKQGLGDTKFADETRDDMDEPWYKLTADEREEYDKFYKELYKNE